MEKSLIEKMENGTCDDIDKEMIVSRVLKAVKELNKVVDTFTDSLKELREQYADELKLSGATIVFGVAVTSLSHEKEKDFELLSECVIGTPSNVDKAILKLMKDAK